MSRFISFALAVALLLVGGASAPAATILFDINLDGLQETPPNASPGSGFGTLTLNDITGAYTTSGTFTGLVGTTTAAHIHGPAAPGTAAGVVVGLTFDPGVTAGNFSGAGTFTAPQMADLINELYYVNIHTNVFPGGEIRGQILKVPEPASLVLLGLGAFAVVTAARRRRMRAC